MSPADEKTTSVVIAEEHEDLLAELEQALDVLLKVSEPPARLAHRFVWDRAVDRAYAALIKARSR